MIMEKDSKKSIHVCIYQTPDRNKKNHVALYQILYFIFFRCKIFISELCLPRLNCVHSYLL